MFELKFSENTSSNLPEELGHCQEVRRFYEKVSNGMQLTAGHETHPLFWRSEVNLMNNQEQVIKGMLWQNITGTINYVALINNIINKGYAEEVPQLSLEADLSKVWSISHDGVYHPIKPEEIRVVFNCSTKFAGTSLVGYGMTVLSFDDASSPSCSKCAL